MKIFQCKAMGDTVYIQAENLDAAKERLETMMGKIPLSMLTWKEVKALPKGEEFL